MSLDKQMTTRAPHANAKAMQRVADAWAMRVRGATWDEVASAVGYANGPNALRAVRNFAGKLPELEASELRSLWRERMEFLWPVAVRDVEGGKPGAMRAAVAVAQRAAQLDGLDQPQRIELNADASELDAWCGRCSPRASQATTARRTSSMRRSWRTARRPTTEPGAMAGLVGRAHTMMGQPAEAAS